MAQLTLRNIDDQVVRALKQLAAARGRSAKAGHRKASARSNFAQLPASLIPPGCRCYRGEFSLKLALMGIRRFVKPSGFVANETVTRRNYRHTLPLKSRDAKAAYNATSPKGRKFMPSAIRQPCST